MRIRLLILILFSVLSINSISAQKSGKKITISGTVVDVANEPIANAIIMIDDKKTNSLTDSQGAYKIKVKSTASRIGIFTFGNGISEQAIDGRTKINFNFTSLSSQQQSVQTNTEGEEGVDVGYGYVKEKNLTNQVNHIDGTNKKYASYATIYDMIQRECTGVRVDGTNIVIQDSKNLWGVIPPLLVVDGVYVQSLGDIQPTIVKSIEVLKGSSAAIYGSRGYGGVIVIKTKIQND